MSERRRGALDTMVGRNLTRIGFSEGVNDVGWYMVLYESELREDLRQGGEGTKSKKEEEMLCINLYFVSRERRRNGGRDGGGSDRTTGGWIGYREPCGAGRKRKRDCLLEFGELVLSANLRACLDEKGCVIGGLRYGLSSAGLGMKRRGKKGESS